MRRRRLRAFCRRLVVVGVDRLLVLVGVGSLSALVTADRDLQIDYLDLQIDYLALVRKYGILHDAHEALIRSGRRPASVDPTDGGKTMTLEELVGQHLLTGVEFQTTPGVDDDATVLLFVLDGTTYTASEDANDGYRSSLGELAVTQEKVRNCFPPHAVLGRMRSDAVLEFLDAQTGKVVLAVGTDDADDYYPSFVGEWNPENLHVNATT